jgi:hypothetical protein
MGFLIPGSLVRVQPGVMLIFAISGPPGGALLGQLLGSGLRFLRQPPLGLA